MRYWIWLNDLVQGPFEPDELMNLRAFHEELLVCMVGSEEWIPAGRVADLSSAIEAIRTKRAEPLAPPLPPKHPPVISPLQGEFFGDAPEQQHLLEPEQDDRGPFAYRAPTVRFDPSGSGSALDLFRGEATTPFHFERQPESLPVLEVPRPTAATQTYRSDPVVKQSPLPQEIFTGDEAAPARPPAVVFDVLGEETAPPPLPHSILPAAGAPFEESLPSMRKPSLLPWLAGIILALLILGSAGRWVLDRANTHSAIAEAHRLENVKPALPPAPVQTVPVEKRASVIVPSVAPVSSMNSSPASEFASVKKHMPQSSTSKRVHSIIQTMTNFLNRTLHHTMTLPMSVTGSAVPETNPAVAMGANMPSGLTEGASATNAAAARSANAADSAEASASESASPPSKASAHSKHKEAKHVQKNAATAHELRSAAHSKHKAKHGRKKTAAEGVVNSTMDSGSEAASSSSKTASADSKASPHHRKTQHAKRKAVPVVSTDSAGAAPAAFAGAGLSQTGNSLSGLNATASATNADATTANAADSTTAPASESASSVSKPAPRHTSKTKQAKNEAANVTVPIPDGTSSGASASGSSHPGSSLPGLNAAASAANAAGSTAASAASPAASSVVSAAVPGALPPVPPVDPVIPLEKRPTVVRAPDPWAGQQNNAIQIAIAKNIPGYKISVGEQARDMLQEMHEKELLHAAETGERLYLPDKLTWTALQETGPAYRVYLNFFSWQPNGERVQARSYQFRVDLKTKVVQPDDTATTQDLLTRPAILTFKHNPMAGDIDSILGGVDIYNKHSLQLKIIKDRRSNREDREKITQAMQKAQAKLDRAVLYFRKTYTEKALQNVAKAYMFTELVK